MAATVAMLQRNMISARVLTVSSTSSFGGFHPGSDARVFFRPAIA